MLEDAQGQKGNEESCLNKRPKVSNSEHNVSAVVINRNNDAELTPKLDKSASKAPVTILHLPDELLATIVHYIKEDTCLRLSARRTCSSERCDCSSCRQHAWFKYVLPLVHPRFFHVLAPSPKPCLQLPDRTDTPYQQELIAYMSCPAFARTLAHTRHIRINFEELRTAGPVYSRDSSEESRALTNYLAHIYLICLSAVNLETLELGDLVINEGDVHHLGFSSPFRRFSQAKPLQFDLACSRLLKALPDIFTAVSESITGPERVKWEPDALQRFLDQFHRIVKRPGPGRGLGFPHLKHVYLMDGNEGVTIDDYADLFLVPCHLCMPSIAYSDELSAARCEIWGSSCTAKTVCPSLSSLTLVLWYGTLRIDPVFLHAMVHLVHHHPHLTTLNLISRRLRYEPRFLNPGVSLEQWFSSEVVPMLRLAQELLADKLKLTIYILTNFREEERMRGAIKTHWHAVRAIFVDTISVTEFSPKEVHREATGIHHKLCKDDVSGKKLQEHRTAELDSAAIKAFFTQ